VSSHTPKCGVRFLFCISTVFLLLLSGCREGVQRRLAFSMKMVEKQHAAARASYWKQMYARMSDELKEYEKQSLETPRLLAVGLLEADDSYLLSLYWATAKQEVEGFVIGLPDGAPVLSLDVPQLYREMNQREMKRGVMGHAVFKWERSDLPRHLLGSPARVALRIQDGQEELWHGHGILRASTTNVSSIVQADSGPGLGGQKR